MYARKAVDRIEDHAPDDAPLPAILRHVDASNAEAVAKDAWLVMDALRADRVVLSRDDTMRSRMHDAAAHVPALRTIEWANACRTAGAIDWLRAGAPAPSEFRLGER
ncbi:MAG: hypothetical protein ACKVT1_13210 [Dehalococcoidia bacterium]